MGKMGTAFFARTRTIHITKIKMGPKGNKAAVAKLTTIGEIQKDADQSRSIPDMLRKKLISAGLTDSPLLLSMCEINLNITSKSNMLHEILTGPF